MPADFICAKYDRMSLSINLMGLGLEFHRTVMFSAP